MTPQGAKNCCVTFFPSPTPPASAACINFMNWRAIPVTSKLTSPPAYWWKARTSALMIWETMMSLRTAPQWNSKQKSSGHHSVQLRRTVTLTALPPSQKSYPLSPLCPRRGIPAGWFTREPPTFEPSHVRCWLFCLPLPLCCFCFFFYPVTLLIQYVWFEACSLLFAVLHPSDALNKATKQNNFLWTQINSLKIYFRFGILRWYFSLISAQTGNTMRVSATRHKCQAEHVLAFNEQCVVLTALLVWSEGGKWEENRLLENCFWDQINIALDFFFPSVCIPPHFLNLLRASWMPWSKGIWALGVSGKPVWCPLCEVQKW